MNIGKDYYRPPYKNVHMDLHMWIANRGFVNKCETIGINKK